MIAIVNAGMGNVHAFATIYKRLNIAARIATTADELRVADKIILPGVGAFDWAMARLEASGLRQTLDELVLTHKRPVLGVCVGMQMMAKRSEEGSRAGLGWIDASVKKLDGAVASLPHMGWNDVAPRTAGGLFADLGPASRFYFLHSYYVAPEDAAQTLATTDYHGSFSASVHLDHVFGVQFHPEKSHHWGIQLLRNFAEL